MIMKLPYVPARDLTAVGNLVLHLCGNAGYLQA